MHQCRRPPTGPCWRPTPPQSHCYSQFAASGTSQQGACCSPRAIHKQQLLCPLATVSPLCVSVTFSCLFVVLSSISMSLDVYLSISHLFFMASVLVAE